MENIEPKFRVVLGFENDLGEMTETEVYGHIRTRLQCDPSKAEEILNAVKDQGVFSARFVESLGNESTMEIRRQESKQQ